MSQEVHYDPRGSRSPSPDGDRKPDLLDMDENATSEGRSSPSSDEATLDGDPFDRNRTEMVDRIMRSLCAALDSKLSVVKETRDGHVKASLWQMPPLRPPVLPLRHDRFGGSPVRFKSPTLQLGIPDAHVKKSVYKAKRRALGSAAPADSQPTYIPQGDTYGEGVGISGLGFARDDSYSTSRVTWPFQVPPPPPPFPYDQASKDQLPVPGAGTLALNVPGPPPPAGTGQWQSQLEVSMGPLPPYASTENFEAVQKGAVCKLADPEAEAELPPTRDGFYHSTSDIVEYELPEELPSAVGHVRTRASDEGDDVLDSNTSQDRHDDKHSESSTPPMFFACLFTPCQYKSDREAKCKLHMEQAHGWTYVRCKSNGKTAQHSVTSAPPAYAPQGMTTADHIMLPQMTPLQGGSSTTASASSVSSTVQPDSLAAQWPLERVVAWLRENGFSIGWQETFRILNICGAKFLDLGGTHGGRGNFGMMHQQVYPTLARECERRGAEWDLTKEREEGKRIHRLIKSIRMGGTDSSNRYSGDIQGPDCVMPMLARPMIPLNVEPAIEDGDGDGRRKRARRGSSAAEVAGGSVSSKFACPYFKRNPKKYRKWTSCQYRKWTSCPGPGWGEVHRVKTHLYRRHQLPIQCPRCWTVFKTDDQRQSHLQQDPPCAVQPNQMLHEGFTKDQERRLRSRKKTQADATDEAKWREIYMILFPDDDLGAIPSPYYGDSDGNGADSSTGGSGDFEDYATFIRREMPTLVRRELEVLFRDEFQDVEERLRPRVAEIVLNLQPRLLSLYKQSQMPLSEYGPMQHGDTASGSEKMSTPSLSQSSATVSGTNSTPTTLPGVNGSLVEVETQPDWYEGIRDTGCDAGDFWSQVFAQQPPEMDTSPGVDWEHEFDTLLNQVLYPPPVDMQAGCPSQAAQASSAQGG